MDEANTAGASARFGRVVRQRREELKASAGSRWTVRALAERLGVKHTYLVAIEAGRSAPSDRIIQGLAGELELDRDSLHALAGTIPPDVRDAVARNASLFRLVRALADADDERVDRVVRDVREGEW